MCAGILSAVILSRLFSKSDYATYRQVLLVFTFATPILLLGLPEALYYFLSVEKKRPRSVLMENLLVIAVTSTLLSLFLLLGGNRLLAKGFDNPALAGVLLIMAPYPLFSMPLRSLRSCLVIHDRFKLVAVLDVLDRVLMLLFVAVGVLIWGTPTAAVAGVVIAACITFGPAMWFGMSSTRGPGSWRPSARSMWNQVGYAVPLGLATMIGTIMRSLDKIVVSSIRPLEEYAVFVNGAMEIPLIGAITGSVMMVLFPEIVRLCKGGDTDAAIRLWQKAAEKCALFIFPSMCVVIAMAPEIMSALYSRKYIESAAVFQIYALLLPVRIVTWGIMFMAADRSRLILLKSVVGLVINLVLSVLFVWMWGLLGAAIGTIVTIYVWDLPFSIVGLGKIYNTGVRRLLPYGYLLKVFAISAAAGVVFVPNWFWRGGITDNDWLLLGIYLPGYTTLLLLLFSVFKIVSFSAILKDVRSMIKK